MDTSLYETWFHTSKQFLQSVTKRIEGYGLSLDSFRVLELLYSHPKESFTVQQISKTLEIPSGSITHVINQLVKKEVVTKKPCPTDKRCSFVELTKFGSTLISSLLTEHFRYLESNFSALNETEKNTLHQLLLKMNS